VQIANIAARLDAIREFTLNIEPSVDEARLDAAIAEIQLKFDTLRMMAIDPTIDQATIDAQLAVLQAKLRAFAHLAGVNLEITGLPTALAELTAFAGALRAVSDDEDRMIVQSGLIMTFFQNWGTVIHWVVAGGSELAAVGIPAIIAAAAGAAVLYQGVMERVAYRMESLYTTTEALGPAFNTTSGDILGTGDALQAMQDKMNPVAWSMLGDAIDIARQHLGDFVTMGGAVAQVIQKFSAEIAVDLNGAFGTELTQMVSKGVEDLVEFGQVLGNLGHAILNLAGDMPGLAEVLLKVLDAFTQLILKLTEIPGWIITVAMGFEEFLRWGGLLLDTVGRLVLALGSLDIVEGITPMIGDLGEGMLALTRDEEGARLGMIAYAQTLLTFLATNPVGWAIDAAAAITALTIVIARADSGTTNWIDTQNKLISTATDYKVINDTVSTLVATNQDLAAAQANLNTKTSAFQAIASGAQGAVSALTQEHDVLNQQLVTETKNVGLISSTYGFTFAESLGVAQAAGVNLSQTLIGNSHAAQVARQEIEGLVTGYEAIGQVGGALGASMNAVSYQASFQDTQVNKLDEAWDSYFQTLTGGTSALASFGTDVAGLSKVTDNIEGSASAWTSFNSAVVQAGQTSDWLRDALASGALSAGQYQDAVKGLVAQMLPFAASSQTAQAELIGVAQQIDPNISSYKQLTQWVGNTKSAQDDLNTAVDQATQKLGNLNSIATDFTGTLQTDVIQATDKAVIAQGGFNGLLDATTQALKNSGEGSSAYKNDLAQLDDFLRTKLGWSTQQINTYNAELVQSFTAAGDSATKAGQKMDTAVDPSKIANNSVLEDIKNFFTAIGHYIESDYFDAPLQLMIKGWDNGILIVEQLWGDFENAAKQTGQNLVNSWRDSTAALEQVWKDTVDDAAGIWNDIGNDIYDPVVHGAARLITFFETSFDTWWKTHGSALEAIWQQVWGTISGTFEEFYDILMPLVKTLWSVLESTFDIGADQLEGIVKVLWDIVEGAWSEGANFVELTWRMLWDTLELVGETAGAVLETLFKVVWAAIQLVWNEGVSVIELAWKILWDTVQAVAETAWAAIQLIEKVGWDTLVALFSVMIDLLSGHWSQAWDDIKTYGEQIWNAIDEFFQDAWKAWEEYGENIFNDFKDFLEQTWNNISSFMKSTWNAISSFFDSEWNNFKSFGESIFNAFRSFLTSTWDDIESTTKSVWNSIMSMLQNVWSDMKSGFSGAVSGIKSTWSSLEGIFESPVKFLVNTVYDGGIARLWNDVAAKIPGVPSLPTFNFAAGGKADRSMRVPGWGGGDIVPAMIEPGETVVSKEHSSKLASVFKALGVPGYASGGIPGGGVISDITGAVSGAASDVFSGIKDIGSLVAALATGNTTALLNDMMKFTGGSGGATGDLAGMIVQIPKTIVTDLIRALTTTFKGAVTAGAGVPGGISAGDSLTNLVTVARYLMANGYTRTAAAGIAGDIYGESGGNPESVGSGGAGLIGWTPPSSARPYQPIVTGNASHDLAIQMADLLEYNKTWSEFIPLLNSAATATAAGQIYSEYFERPAVLFSDTRPGIANQVYGSLAAGGFLPPGQNAWVGEQGMEAAYARPGGGVDITPVGPGGGKSVTVYQQYYGTQYPTPEMMAQQKVNLALALGVAP
jgi:phage-related protein